jgi:hypothetical protein
VTFDLETLYNKLDSIAIDIKTVREDGIYKVLDKNQLKIPIVFLPFYILEKP